MRAVRLLVLATALACASAARAADDCTLESARAMLAARLKDWFSVNNNAWLRDPQRYAALALDDSDAAPDALRDGIVIEVRAPSHGSCVKFLMELDPSGEPRLSVIEERACSKRARDERIVSVVVEEQDMRPDDVGMTPD
jgi:hypothetical protein